MARSIKEKFRNARTCIYQLEYGDHFTDVQLADAIEVLDHMRLFFIEDKMTRSWLLLKLNRLEDFQRSRKMSKRDSKPKTKKKSKAEGS